MRPLKSDHLGMFAEKSAYLWNGKSWGETNTSFGWPNKKKHIWQQFFSFWSCDLDDTAVFS